MNVKRPTFIVCLLLAGCTQKEPVGENKLTAVHMQAASSGPAAPGISSSGVVVTKDEMRLSFKVGGVIRGIPVEEGQAVRKGQKLAEIELTEIDSQVQQMQLMAEKADRDLERAEKLYTDRIISLGQLQDLRTQAAMQRAQLKTAQFNRSYSTIESPRDGVVLRKLAQERELIQAGQPVLVLGGHSRGYVVRVALADREIVRLKLGDPAQIRIDAYPGQTIKGTLTQIAGAVDEKTGLFPVEVRIDNPPGALASGLVAKVDLQPPQERVGTLTYVPIAAVVEGDRDTASVFVLDGNKAKRRSVSVAFIAPEAVALTSGLQPGEQVVTDGALYLQDGEAVEIVSGAVN